MERERGRGDGGSERERECVSTVSSIVSLASVCMLDPTSGGGGRGECGGSDPPPQAHTPPHPHLFLF